VPHGILDMSNLINMCANVKLSHGMSDMFNFINMCANVKEQHSLFDMSNLTNMFVINMSVPHGLSYMINLIIVNICMITWN